MTNLQFSLKDYSVAYRGDRITLLRKEYNLLQFLYEHANQPFSREQLLNAVWFMEEPSDRTVDDHIYRLRKKLKPWKDLLSIDTVKGFGYQLVLKEDVHPSPLAQDKEVIGLIESLLTKYHQYGDGHTLDSIYKQNALGVELPIENEPIIAFMRGDFWWFVQDNKHPITAKLFILTLIFQTLSLEYQQMITYIQKGIKSNLFGIHSYEAKTLTLFFSLVFGKQYEEAEGYLHQLSTDIAPEIFKQEHIYYPFLQNTRQILALSQGQIETFEEIHEEMTHFFTHKPYQRELGILTIIKGLYSIHRGFKAQGHLEVDKGFEIIKKTRFTPHMFIAFEVSLFLLQHAVTDEGLLHNLEDKRSRLIQELNYEGLLKDVRAILNRYLA